MIDHDNEEKDIITANKFTPFIYNHTIMIHDINNRVQNEHDMMTTSTTFSP